LGMEYCEDEEFDKKEKEKDKRRTEFNIGNINNAFDEDYENNQNGEEEHGFRNGGGGSGRPVECATQ